MPLRILLGGLLALVSTWAGASLVTLPRQLVVDSSGDPRSGAKLYTYDCGTTTPLTTYTTPALGTAHANPVVSASSGLFPAIYTGTNVTCLKLVLKDSADVTLYTEDNIPVGSSAGAAVLDVRSFGVVADDNTKRAANTAALIDLVDASETGPEGRVVFPNPDGTTTYYFDADYIEVRDRIAIDCNGATLDFSGSYDAANDTKGFLTFIRDVSVENCKFNIDYDGSAGTNNGSAIRMGARAGSYGFADAQTTFEEENISEPMGDIVLRNIEITTNNADTTAILAVGGLQNVLMENVRIDGADSAPRCFYYEFGQYHYEGGAAGDNNISTHALNLKGRNWHCSNVTSTAVEVVGAMTFSIDGLWVDDAATVFAGRLGEAGYYNMAGTPTEGMKAHYDLHNIYGTDISSTGISMLGSESLLSGYLATDIGALAAEAEAQAQTDKITYNLDGFYLADSAIIVNAPHVRIANGTQKAGGTRGIWIQSETTFFDIDNVNVLDNDGTGIASDTGGQIYVTARFRNGQIRNCFVAGNGADGGDDAGIALSQMKGVVIDACRFGYETAHDGVAESTQGAGVSNQATTTNLTIRNSYGGGTTTSMYVNSGSGGWKYARLENVGGTVSTSGQWTRNGIGIDTDIGDADTTLDVGTDLPVQRYATTLTGNRTVTCGTSTAYTGAEFTVIRTGLGSFTLDVCGLKTIASATAASVRVIYNGSAWQLANYSAL